MVTQPKEEEGDDRESTGVDTEETGGFNSNGEPRIDVMSRKDMECLDGLEVKNESNNEERCDRNGSIEVGGLSLDRRPRYEKSSSEGLVGKRMVSQNIITKFYKKVDANWLVVQQVGALLSRIKMSTLGSEVMGRLRNTSRDVTNHRKAQIISTFCKLMRLRVQPRMESRINCLWDKII